ncbi:MAG TPA: hypothetical protein VJP79_01410 [Nitrososphaera sp.]|nr:hypothetical protein [Nitrososphaera sp.]
MLIGPVIATAIPNFFGLLLGIFWTFAIVPTMFIKLFLSGRKRKRKEGGEQPDLAYKGANSYKARPHSGAVSSPHDGVAGQSQISRIVPQVTQRGEVVKSGGERVIADYLFSKGIKYEYEKPALDPSGRRISRPDFFLSEYNAYIEYWGMVNSKEKTERQEYIRSMEWKMKRYRENGMKFISVYPKDLDSLDVVLKKSRLGRATQTQA